MIPLKEVSDLKDEIDFILNGSVEVIKHVEVPALPQYPKSEREADYVDAYRWCCDMHLCDVIWVDVYFKLPEKL